MAYQAKLPNLTPLPGYLLYPTDDTKAKAYDNLKSDDERFKEGGKWWSMYDIMKEFHSGILPEHSDANYLEFEIDFTSPHLKVATITDPNMVQELNSTMTIGLQSLSSKIQSLISKLQLEANVQAMRASTSGVLSRQQQLPGGGGKRKKKGGAPGDPPNAADEINNLVNPTNLEKECLKDIFRVKVNSWDRIFITNAKKDHFPLKSVLNLPDQAAVMEQVKIAEIAAEAEAAAPEIQVGGRRKTRKGRKYGKRKAKTHRKYRR